MALLRKTRMRCSCGYSFKGETRKLLRKCPTCGAARLKKTKPKHMAALDLPYEQYVQINGGEHCAVCGTGPTEMRRLDRDHDHKTGLPRGLLCHRHNRMLSPRMGWTPDALRAAAVYLERAA